MIPPVTLMCVCLVSLVPVAHDCSIALICNHHETVGKILKSHGSNSNVTSLGATKYL